MSRRVLWIDRPGIEGIVTDVDPHQLGPRQVWFAQDAIRPEGIIRQRRGWAYDGSVADVADNLVTVARAKFIAANQTRTITVDDDGDGFIHNPSGAGSAILTDTVPYLARAIYNDELILCAQDGETPLRRYSGAGFDSESTVTTVDCVGGTATAHALSYGASVIAGSFINLDTFVAGGNHNAPLSVRVIERASSTVLSLDGMNAAAKEFGTQAWGCGWAYPCVSVYDAGHGSFDNANDEFDGTGTLWTTGDWGGVYTHSSNAGGDCLLAVRDAAAATHHYIDSASADGVLELLATDKTDTTIKYHITRRCPFKDVAAHKGSLFGAGVKQHRTRVYVGPPGWNLAYPPGFPLPFDPSAETSADDYQDYLLDYIDVPAPNHDDEIVALVSSDNPLIALGRRDAWGIYGSYGGLEVSMLPGGEGTGCMDIRSAWELSIGPVWASEQGLMAFVGGQVVNLCKGRIETEWRSLASRFSYGSSDWISVGEADGVIVVHITTNTGGETSSWFVYPYDVEGRLNPAWFEVTNITPRFLWTSKVPGEAAKLLGVQNDDQGRVINFAPCVVEGTADAVDDDNTAPVLKLWLPWNLPRLAGASVEERILELAVEATVYDSAGATSTLGGSVITREVLDTTTALTTTLSSMASSTTNVPRVFRHKIGTKGQLHEVRLEKTATPTTGAITEIHRVGFTVRTSRRVI